MYFSFCVLEVTCKPPHPPDNGHVSFNSLEYESELKYKCDKGYHLSIDDETVFCTAEGTWSSTEVKCIGKLSFKSY